MEWPAVFSGIAIALASVIVGWGLSLITIRKQLEGQRREEVKREGRQAALDAIDCLLTLRRDLPFTVGVSPPRDDAREALCKAELEKLERLGVRIPDSIVRRRVEIVHDVLGWPNEVCQYGGPDVGWPHQIVYRACSEGLEVLGSYARGEVTPSEPSPMMIALTEAQDATVAEKNAQWEEIERQRTDGSND